MAEEKIQMTREGLEKLEKEYRNLLEVQRPEIIEALKAARSQGDLSENADYDAARNRQAEIEARIAQIEHIKDVMVLVDEGKGGKAKKINLGHTVTYTEKESGETFTVKLVGTVEANAMAEPPLISNESAIGKALVGKVPGDDVLVATNNPYMIHIDKALFE